MEIHISLSAFFVVFTASRDQIKILPELGPINDVWSFFRSLICLQFFHSTNHVLLIPNEPHLGNRMILDTDPTQPTETRAPKTKFSK